MNDFDEFVQQGPPNHVLDTLLEILWDSSSTSFAPNDHVYGWIEILRAREDADNPLICKAIAECAQYVAI